MQVLSFVCKTAGNLSASPGYGMVYSIRQQRCPFIRKPAQTPDVPTGDASMNQADCLVGKCRLYDFTVRPLAERSEKLFEKTVYND